MSPHRTALKVAASEKHVALTNQLESVVWKLVAYTAKRTVQPTLLTRNYIVSSAAGPEQILFQLIKHVMSSYMCMQQALPLCGAV